MMYWNGHMTTAGWIVAILWTAIVFALIAGAVYWLVSTLTGRGPGASAEASGEASAREILDRRLAKGEITIEQHERIRDAIDDAGASSANEPSSSPAASAPE